MKIEKFVLAVLVCCGFTAASADGSHGKIKICRIALPGSSTGSVFLPADGTYTASCESDEGCRKFVIGVTAVGTLPAGASSCATLNAVLLQDDGQPIVIGKSLVANWNTGSLASHITVVETFK